MKKILTYSNRKIDDIVWDVSTPKLEKEARKELFKILDKEWQMFSHIEKHEENNEEVVCPTCKHKTIKKIKGGLTYDYKRLVDARRGDEFSIRSMLEMVQGHEYGDWRIRTVQ